MKKAILTVEIRLLQMHIPTGILMLDLSNYLNEI